jgi:hypothetical protein
MRSVGIGPAEFDFAPHSGLRIRPRATIRKRAPEPDPINLPLVPAKAGTQYFGSGFPLARE